MSSKSDKKESPESLERRRQQYYEQRLLQEVGPDLGRLQNKGETPEQAYARHRLFRELWKERISW